MCIHPIRCQKVGAREPRREEDAIQRQQNETKAAGLEPTTFGVLVVGCNPEPKTDALAIAPRFLSGKVKQLSFVNSY